MRWLRLARGFHLWAADRALRLHVTRCHRCTKNLVDCDETDFCKFGRLLFIESFDVNMMQEGHL